MFSGHQVVLGDSSGYVPTNSSRREAITSLIVCSGTLIRYQVPSCSQPGPNAVPTRSDQFQLLENKLCSVNDVWGHNITQTEALQAKITSARINFFDGFVENEYFGIGISVDEKL